ncbi:uncharacterized protein PV07_02481 [Cladophialophora immunda]|uniref:Mid2 domain-containing protein n=1 Tax=Cladophialophora immunda TaxID=569365 RepID=A0A0D2D527_9EURO|nr:uncharacterized protein PV07_02481 [Cladophialophora immunda]KIW30779.1 hypothetical protein PV07_02481 [Cladophialophora immunda]OQU99267.1 hypothetical protein CLAIMM_04926 [Cladophialophora immunda]
MQYCCPAYLVFFTLFPLGLAATNVCYNPDGTQTARDTYSPCFPNTNVTHCCPDGSTCLKNGLCLMKNDTTLNTGLCTDSTWQDDACFPRCLTSQRKPGPSSLYRCNNSKWCCSDGASNSTSCCQDAGVKLFPIIAHAAVENGSAFLHGYSIAPIASIISNGALPSTTALQTVTFTTDISGSLLTITATTTGDPSPVAIGAVSNSNTGLKTGLGTGLGVGVPFLAVIAVLSFLLFREKKRHRATLESLSSNDGYPLVSPQPILAAGHYQVATGSTNDQWPYTAQQPAEVDSREKRTTPLELPAK